MGSHSARPRFLTTSAQQGWEAAVQTPDFCFLRLMVGKRGLELKKKKGTEVFV